MTLRILHTADNHIGISFNQHPPAVRDHLLEERFVALENLVKTANQRQAHFFVVAGDLFDKVRLPKKTIARTVKILAGFEGEAVLVLAGNHDYYEGAESELWKSFRSAAEGTCVVALTESGPCDFSGDEFGVRFYACPCPSKHSREHTIGWVAEAEKPADTFHIGIAHGNLQGLGLDAGNNYFSMTSDDLRSAGLHTWLLGHIHVPSPAPGTTGRPPFFMPGIHTPDSVKCTHPGHAWWIELQDDGSCEYEQLTTGSVRFLRFSRVLNHADDIMKLQTQCEELDGAKTILDLQLTGRLRKEELTRLNELLKKLAPRFLHFTFEKDVATVLDAAAISQRFPERTLPNALLKELLADDAHPGDAQLALEIIETILPLRA